jgi:hypothetical protein
VPLICFAVSARGLLATAVADALNPDAIKLVDWEVAYLVILIDGVSLAGRRQDGSLPLRRRDERQRREAV